MADDQPWMILQREILVFDKPSAVVYCDRRQHLLVFHYPTNKNAATGTISSASSAISTSDNSSTVNGRSIPYAGTQTVIGLEHIQYIQQGGGVTRRRSARYYSQLRSTRQHGHYNPPQEKQLEIYYCPDHPRSEYLYKMISFQLKQNEDEFDKWINALYAVISEAKNLNEAAKRNRWLLREYEKLKRSSGGLTFDSINGWLNSHIGLVGEKGNIERVVKQHETYRQSNEITDAVFKTIYNSFVESQQKILIKSLMNGSIDDEQISLDKFASHVTNNENLATPNELESIRKFLRLDEDEKDISFKQCINYLWSEANSAFDPVSCSTCVQDMDQPLNHYWISSSHNTYLAKTQIFNPASVHCYIQALLKGCRCIEIDVMDKQISSEPIITHKKTQIKSIPLRDVLEAIQDYAFIASDYPVIISIENHCSTEQRNIMARMFIEIFGENLVQSTLSPNETCLPSPNQFKRKIILKDSKIYNTSPMISPSSAEPDEHSDMPPLGCEGPVQIYDFAKKTWFLYNYSFSNSYLYLARDHETLSQRSLDNYSSDEEEKDEDLPDDELTQIWYHRNISHADSERLLLSNAGYEIGTFLVRKSLNKNCYCLSLLASTSSVRSVEIKEKRYRDGKRIYAIADKTFDSIPDLVSHYQTYDFAEINKGSGKLSPYRLGKPLPRETWRKELEQQPWYQPNLAREQAEDLLLGTREEMSFLIRDSSSRARQDYSISLYTNGTIRHSPIYRDGSDLMLMSVTFTSLIELVSYYTRKPIFEKMPLGKPALSYEDFISKQRQFGAQGIHKEVMNFIPLKYELTLKISTLRTLEVTKNQKDLTVDVQLYIYEEDKTKQVEGYLLKFDLWKDWEDMFVPNLNATRSLSDTSRRGSASSVGTIGTIGTISTKSTNSSLSIDSSQSNTTELDKLIIYCLGVKLKRHNITKAQDLREKIRSFKEMVSLNYVKAATFCSDAESMILFNQNHFTRIYPDFSRKSWNSHNFEPILYWLTGCQMVALNFQMPDRPMHANHGRFAANGGCGYVLMPNYIRSYVEKKTELNTGTMLLKIRIVAVRHLRTNQAKSISKVIIKTTIISRPKSAESQHYQTTINGPCGILDSKQSSSKHNDQSNRLTSTNSHVDLLYFEVTTDNQDFCGQSAIPLSSVKPGIRSVQLFDKFNERLEMSALLVDIR